MKWIPNLHFDTCDKIVDIQSRSKYDKNNRRNRKNLNKMISMRFTHGSYNVGILLLLALAKTRKRKCQTS